MKCIISMKLVVFKKIYPNLVLVIKKTSVNFQNLHESVIDKNLQNKRRNIVKWLKNKFVEFIKLMKDSN